MMIIILDSSSKSVKKMVDEFFELQLNLVNKYIIDIDRESFSIFLKMIYSFTFVYLIFSNRILKNIIFAIMLIFASFFIFKKKINPKK